MNFFPCIWKICGLSIWQKKIQIFHYNGGGEILNSKLTSHFQAYDILHQMSCPHTPEQNGMVERRHWIIRELGMTMLFHSSAPLCLWIETFVTTGYLINRLSSSTLDVETLYFKLHVTHPVYSSLRIFGSHCFSYTGDTNKNKFDSKIVPCVFVGYSDRYKGYKFFHPTT